MNRIASYLKAKWSKGLFGAKVDTTNKDIRLLSCFGDGVDIAVCPGIRASAEEAGKFYCGECGCGDRKATWLNNDKTDYGKLDHPFVVCPRKMPGFSNYETDIKDSRKVAVELRIGDDITNKSKVKPTPETPKVETQPKPTKKCNTCAEKSKASQEKNARRRELLIEAAKVHNGRIPQTEVARIEEIIAKEYPEKEKHV